MTPTFRGIVHGGNPIEPFGVDDDGWTMHADSVSPRAGGVSWTRAWVGSIDAR